MTDSGNGVQSKRGRLITTLNNLAHHHHHKGSQQNQIGTMTAPTGSTLSSSMNFQPSFRFSPDSEELEEISSNSFGADDRQTESLPESPKMSRSNTTSQVGTSGGDTSPIKEYIRKNWATKWDKRSLSLDLDLKGKIITAIEDKRRSMLSHFIPEENTGIAISPSNQIHEHTGITVAIADSASQHSVSSSDSQLSINPESSLSKESEGKHRSNTKEPFHDTISFDNTLKQVHLVGDTGSRDNLSVTSSDENYEEVGLDYLENMASANEIDGAILDALFPFSFSPDQLQEGTLGTFPHTAGNSPPVDTQKEARTDHYHKEPQVSRSDLEIQAILKDMAVALVLHGYTKYLFALLSAGYIFSSTMSPFLFGLLWFIVGILVATIISQSLFGSEPLQTNQKLFGTEYSSINSKDSEPVPDCQIQMAIGTSYSQPFTFSVGFNQKHAKSQGWMTDLEGEYDPFTYHVRQSKVVFVRLEGPFLYISYPQGKHRISKRRFWSDPQLSTEVTFSRHLIYNLVGAHVFIAPEKLARKRVWSKKYPLAIKLDKFSIMSTISPATSDVSASQSSLAGSPQNTNGKGGANTSPTVQSESTITIESNKYKKDDKEIIREDCGGNIIYLFARTDREKDDWYRRLVAAAKEERPFQIDRDKYEVSSYVLQKLYMAYMNRILPKPTEDTVSGESHTRKEAASSSSEKPSKPQASPLTEKKVAKEKTQPTQHNKLGKDSQQHSFESTSTSAGTSSKGETPTDNFSEIEKIFTVVQSPDFLNALLGRIFFDFLRSNHWTTQVQKLIQKKLNYIRRPQFLDELIVKDLDLGRSIPTIIKASTPFVDPQGLWIELDITYEGNLCVTLETKLNLMKLRKSPTSEIETQTIENVSGASDERQTEATSSVIPNFLDSDADDSGESSDDEEVDPEVFLAHQEITSQELQQSGSDTSAGKPSKGAKILKFAEKFANSNFVNDVKVVKKVIENVANIPLILSVELKSCIGTLVLNVPPPPTDRLWVGFRTNPDMQVVVKPKVGERAVNLTHVTEFIRKKLLFEFQRVMVLPNMDDFTIPLMEFKLPTY